MCKNGSKKFSIINFAIFIKFSILKFTKLIH